jgi:hypothetical protein
MNTYKGGRAVLALCAAGALAACASPGTSPASSQGLSSLPALAAAAATTNVAGRYQGTFKIKFTVAGKASFDLTQSGNAIGGTLKLVLSSQTLREPVAMTLAKGNTFTGTAVDLLGKTKCTYGLSGSYNPKTFVLRGTSSPITCKGKTATFDTTESCFYNTGSDANDVRPNAKGILEC